MYSVISTFNLFESSNTLLTPIRYFSNKDPKALTIIGWVISLFTTSISVYVASKLAYKSSSKLTDIQIKQNYNNNLELRGIDVNLKIYSEMIEIIGKIILINKQDNFIEYRNMTEGEKNNKSNQDNKSMKFIETHELFKSLENYSRTFNFFVKEIDDIKATYKSIRSKEYLKEYKPKEKFGILISKLDEELQDLKCNILKEQINFLKSKKID